MHTDIISPKTHGIFDYAVAGSLLVLPSLLGFSKKIKTIYAIEAMMVLGYTALTDMPGGVRPIIPFKTHGVIDRLNIAQFAIQTSFKPFRKDKKAMIFNIAFTLIAATVVTFTNWKGEED